MKSNYFYILHELFLKGNYIEYTSQFIRFHEKRLIGDEEHLFAVTAFAAIGNWKLVNKCIKLLRKSDSPEMLVKSKLLSLKVGFILNVKSISKGKLILECCNRERKKTDNEELLCFIDKIKYQIKVLLLTLGLANAKDKKKNIKFGLSIFERYYIINKEDALNLLSTIINDCNSYPFPNPRIAFYILSKYDATISTDNDLLLIPVYLSKLDTILKHKYHNKNQLTKSILPDEINEIEKIISNTGFVCSKEVVEGKFGEHLLDLEEIDGLNYLRSSILGLSKYGHYKEAELYYSHSAHWIKTNGLMQVFSEANWDNIIIYEDNANHYKKDNEILFNIHTAYSNADYELGYKLAVNYLNKSNSENNKVNLLCQLADNESKINSHHTSVIELIDKEIFRLKFLENSNLLALLYSRKALLDGFTSDQNWKLAILQYKNTGYTEDEISTLLAFISCQIEKLLRQFIDPFSDPELKSCFDKVNNYLLGNYFIKGRDSLYASFYQKLGQAFLNTNIGKAFEYIEKASVCYLNANSFIQYSINTHYLSGILINYARQSKDIQFYLKAIEELDTAIKILLDNGLIDFAWRLMFLQFTCHFEITNYSLHSSKKKHHYIEAEKTLSNSFDCYSEIFSKITTNDKLDKLMASVALYKDARQLIKYGIQFYFIFQEWKKCILWIEKVYSRSLTANLASCVQPPLISNPLLNREKEINNRLEKETDMNKKRELESKLYHIYQNMMSEPVLADYALKKKKVIPDYTYIIKTIREEQLKHTKDINITFIYYLILDDRIFALCIRSEDEDPLVESIPISANQLTRELNSYRLLLKSYQQINHDVHFWTKHSALISPLSKWTSLGDIICFIPYGFLHDLPFHALLIDGSPLIARNPVFYNNSFLSWEYIRNSNQDIGLFKQITLFGDPGCDLEGANNEVVFISKLLNCNYLTGKEITKKRFLSRLKKSSLFHFAGHGFFEQNDGLISSIKLSNDETVTAKEILHLNLNTNLVVLSACDSGLHKSHIGEDHIGLASSLLSSGVRSVIVSLWPVDDTFTELFFCEFYNNLILGKPKVVALQETMICLMKKNNYKEFYYWGAFSLLGDWK